jgi:aryl sulfotransferase
VLTDTNRWENFKHRAEDVFICTPPKCGTTWTQAIVAMLVFGEVDHGEQPGNVSPWIDANFEPIEIYLKQVEAQTHRRFIKTHTPLDGIPYDPDCTYLVVFRDPRDMFCSMLNHRDNFADKELSFAIFPSGATAFQDWVDAPLENDKFDSQSLAGAAHFLKTYWDYRDLPNVHLFHYSEMKSDLKNNIANMATALNVNVTDGLLDDMTRAATFESMKEKAHQFAPLAGSGLWEEESRFFANGKNAQWKEKLTDENLQVFDAKIGELLSPDQIDWLIRS